MDFPLVVCSLEKETSLSLVQRRAINSFRSIRRRVHISEKTLQCLSGEFEVEPAYGEKREEALRIAGLKTYFIKKVLKHVSCEPK